MNPEAAPTPPDPASKLQSLLRSKPVRAALDVNRWFWWLTGALVVVLLGLHLLLRFWVVPQIPERRAEIEAALSDALQRPVRLGQINAGWSQLQPRVDIASLTVLDRDGHPALVLPAINAAVSWRSLSAGTLVFSRLRTGGLELFLKRTSDGTVLLGDIPLNRGDDNRFVEWLEQQRGIDLERSTIHWDDEQRGTPRLSLREVYLSVRNRGTRHRFGLRATPPDALAGPIDLRGEWNGASVTRSQAGSGRLYGDLQRVDLAALATWLDLPFGIEAGRGGLRVWLDLQGATLAGFTADATLKGLRARLDGAVEALEVAAMGGRIGLVNRPDRHALELRRLSVQTSDGVVAPDTSVLWQQQGEGADARHSLRIEHLVLAPLLQTAPGLPLPAAARDLIARASPRGELRAARAEWRGDWQRPTAYSLSGRFVDLGSAAVDGLPGFDRVSGSVTADQNGGRADLHGGAAPLQLPAVFRRAIPVRSLDASLRWRREGEGWRYELAEARLDTGELQARAKGSWVPAAASMQLDARIEQLEPAAVMHYLPESVGAGTRDWLQAAFPAGGRASGEARLRGDPARFPFGDGQGGRFEATLDLQLPSLAFSPRWPRLQAVEGRVRFVDTALTAEGVRARTNRDALDQIRLSIPDLDAREPVLEVSGHVASSVENVLDYIQGSPLRTLVGGVTDGMSGSGRAGVRVALKVPLNHSADTTVRGEVALEAGRLDLGGGRPPLSDLAGRLVFTERGISSPGLSGSLLGGPTKATLSSQPGGVVRIEASGRTRIAALAQQFPLTVWGLASGESTWRGDMTIGPASTRLLVNSRLEGVTLDLPAPIYKPPAEALALRFLWQSATEGDRYELDIGSRLRARVRTRTGVAGIGSATEQVLLALGEAKLPGGPARGIGLAAELPQFFFTEWQPVVDRFSGGEGSVALPVEAHIRTGRFELEGQVLGQTDLSIERQHKVWAWTVRGADAEGSGQWDPSGSGSVVARLSRLALGPPVDGVSVPQDEAAEGGYPALDVEVGSFQRRGKDFGQLRLKASQQGRDWHIDQLRLAAPEYQLDATGLWQSWRSRPTTDVRLEVKTTDTGRYLERLGYGNLIKAAPASLKGSLRWRGAPTDIDFASLSGQFRLETGKGQFVKAEPGAARLLGILSLQALPRRITLDFRDVFSEGLTFDSIESDLTVAEGVMRTEQLFIDGPGAKVRIKGQADLAKETQDLQVKVSPAMDAATVGALIANPLAGLAVFLAQQLLDDPLGKLVTFNYRITGSWSDPVVTRGSAPEVSGRPKPGAGQPTPGVLPGGVP